LYGHHRKQVDFMTCLGNLHCRSKSGESATNDCDLDSASHGYSENSTQQSARMNKRHSCIDPHSQQHQAKSPTSVSANTLRALANRDSPIDEKQPDPVGQMPNGRGDSNKV